ncbi:MAG: hypothetical protein KF688_12025 [Pirellulales bacterium]|nr:hypothetical protein [Pirellulales bacterium]
MSATQQIVDRLQRLSDESGCRLTAAPSATQQWLREDSRLPPELVDILSESWPSEDVSLGGYELWSLDHRSDSERAKIAFKGGYFLIGSAGNGDLLVVQRHPDAIEECEIGLISHEEMWDKGSALGSVYVPICRGFTTLLDAAEADRLPLDFYDARQKHNA